MNENFSDYKNKKSGIFRRLALVVFNVGYSDVNDIENVKICQLTNIFGLIISFYMFCFAILVLYSGATVLGLFDLFMGVLGIANYFVLRKFHNSRMAANVVVVIMTTVVIYMLGSGGRSGTGLIWIVLYPLVVFPLKGAKKGAVYAVVLLLLTIIVNYFGRHFGLYDYSKNTEFVKLIFQRMIFIYIAVCLVTYTFVRNRYGLYREIKRLSMTDALTLLPNRRSINLMIDYHISLFRRRVYKSKESKDESFNIPFSCILCDIDDFKNVNDTYGHESGDLVLKGFAELLKDTLRGADFVGRWGGEEFLIILGGTTLEQAKLVGKKLLFAVEAHSFTVKGDLSLRLTMSCGIAGFTESLSEMEFFRDLDSNLYKAKAFGKNCVVAEDEVV